MKKLVFVTFCSFLIAIGSCSEAYSNWRVERTALSTDNGDADPVERASQNIVRAMEIADKAIAGHLVGDEMAMARFYNPYTNVRSDEKGSVWMYTSAIEAVNAIMSALKAHRELGNTQLYEDNFERYAIWLKRMYENLAYYQGTFQLTSFTQTKEWTVYGVHRSDTKGTAQVAGIENVYDDQQWLVRELLEAYKLTGQETYLKEAEYLTEYVLDGWDSTRDDDGNEHGGIPWGPGYTTKHACSNGPMVSPLVWLHELYKASDEEVTHRYIGSDNKRQTTRMKKRDYYLHFAEAVYAWQKDNLLREDGVYNDMRGGCGNCDVAYETVDGVRYRAHTPLPNSQEPPYSYNSGTMISGAADLYRVTGNEAYLEDLKKLAENSFTHFAKPTTNPTDHYAYAIHGFNNWFNGVLMRGYVDAYPIYRQVDAYIRTFQQNLDYGYQNFLYNGILPHDLLQGWNEGNQNTEGMFSFTFAAEYALLARYELEK